MNTAAPVCLTNTPPKVSTGFTRLFAGYTRGYLRRRFHAVRILKDGLPPALGDRSLVIFLNHASWWDPLVCVLLAREFFPDRTSFAPIEATMLERYRFFQRLGFFGVDRSARGARKFLQTTRAILASPRHLLWITPQGKFTDPRTRPVQLQRGLSALPPGAIFLPLAIEYSFWHESRPEILLSFGEALDPHSESLGSKAEWEERLRRALEKTQDELAARSGRREADDWLTLNRGRSGVNFIYDSWRWLRARIRREKFVREHRPEVAQ